MPEFTDDRELQMAFLLRCSPDIPGDKASQDSSLLDT
jgi:hypothetical protein